MIRAKVLAPAILLTVLAGVVFTQEEAQDQKTKKDGESKGSKAATYKVEKKPFRIQVLLKGTLEAEVTSELAFRPQPMLQSSPSNEKQTIHTIIEHGAKVKKGDVVVTFDATRLNQTIEDLQNEKKSLEASIKLAEEDVPLLEKSNPAELAFAQRAKHRADEELKYFLEIGRAESEKQADMSVKMDKFYMEYAIEELRQLEKMYKANDLTEETEKMVLRRQQNQVEMATFWYHMAVIDRDYLLKFTLPNREKTLKETQVRAELQLGKAQNTLGPTLAQKQAALAKMRHDLQKNANRLEKLQIDREGMTMRSPIDGIVYHGKFEKGAWKMAAPPAGALTPHGTVTPNEAFLTVIKPGGVVLHLSVEEKDVHLLKPGMEGKFTSVFNPDRKLAARFSKMSPLPASPGKFNAQVALEINNGDTDLMPGLACSVKFVPYSKKDAITVPNKCIEEEDDTHIVYVLGLEGKQERRVVRLGRSDGDQTEILEGLREGEEVLLERPGQKTSEKGKGVNP